MAKDTFIFYTKYKDQFELLTGDEVKNIMLAMCQYAEELTVPGLSDREMLVFSMIKREMDYDREKYEEVCEKRREAGAKGGKAKQTKAKQANANFAKQTESKQAEYESEYDTDIKEKPPIGGKKKSSRFSPPSLDEIKAYFDTKGFKSSYEEFNDHYKANGWIQNRGKPITDWQAAARQWERREPEFKNKSSPNHVNKNKPSFAQRDFDEDEEKKRRILATMGAAERINAQ